MAEAPHSVRATPEPSWVNDSDPAWETTMACGVFLRLVKGLGTFERWKEADLGAIQAALDGWKAAKANEGEVARGKPGPV